MISRGNKSQICSLSYLFHVLLVSCLISSASHLLYILLIPHLIIFASYLSLISKFLPSPNLQVMSQIQTISLNEKSLDWK